MNYTSTTEISNGFAQKKKRSVMEIKKFQGKGTVEQQAITFVLPSRLMKHTKVQV
jgi:hypothetical protein